MDETLTNLQKNILKIVYPNIISTKKEILRGMERRARGRWDTLEEAESKEDSLEGKYELDNFHETRLSLTEEDIIVHSMKMSELQYRLGIIPAHLILLGLGLGDLSYHGLIERDVLEEFNTEINALIRLDFAIRKSMTYSPRDYGESIPLETYIELTKNGARLTEKLGLMTPFQGNWNL